MNGRYVKLYTKNWEQVVFVPFVCKRCGKCCREVGVYYEFINWKRAAKYRCIPIYRLANQFVEHIKKHQVDNKLANQFGEHIKKYRVDNRPCFFYNDKRNKCSIYRIRPSECRSYPLYTDAGSMGIDCPGKIERIKLYEGLAPDCAGTKNKTPICPEVWEEILRKLDSINVSDKIKRKFITINEKEVKGRKQK